MTTQNAKTEAEASPPDISPERPRLRDWLWRPWYAKLWWKSAAVFWVAVILEEAFVPWQLRNSLTEGHEAVVGVVLLSFHPFLILPLLAVGWLRALARQGLTPSRGPHRNMDPTNPGDTRYIWHPANPLNPAWRDPVIHKRH